MGLIAVVGSIACGFTILTTKYGQPHVSEDQGSEAVRLAQSVAQRILKADHVTRTLGIVLDEVGPGHATASMTVTER